MATKNPARARKRVTGAVRHGTNVCLRSRAWERYAADELYTGIYFYQFVLNIYYYKIKSSLSI